MQFHVCGNQRGGSRCDICFGPIKMSYDYTIVLHDGIVTAHKPDCPEVQAARESEWPLLTMLDCEKPIGDAYRKHSCLAHEDTRDRRRNNFLNSHLDDYFPNNESGTKEN